MLDALSLLVIVFVIMTVVSVSGTEAVIVKMKCL